MPAQKTIASLPPGLRLVPSTEEDLALPLDTFEFVYKEESQGKTHPGKSWCEQILLADCQMDVRFN